jgi:methionine-gamma-lyase
MTAFETLSIHAGEDKSAQYKGTNPPINMAIAYRLPEIGPELFEALDIKSPETGHVYTRWSNPTLRLLEKRLAALEGAESAVVFSSGMAAISAFLFTYLSAGDHLITSEICYVATNGLAGMHLDRFGIEVSLVDTSDSEQVEAAMRPNTRVVLIETPSNPILRITDIQAIADIAHAGNAKLIVDSTWATPALQRPLELGADFVMHSLTKYINGHGDALGGVVIGPEDEIQRIRKEMLIHLGGALSPFNAWLILRGMETLSLRMKQHSENAQQIATFLEEHPAISKVTYPGLKSHPHHELAKTQMSNFGGMMTFQLKHGFGALMTLIEKTKIATFASSLGHPNTIYFLYPTAIYYDTLPFLTSENIASIHDWAGDLFVRLSVGLENAQDLIADLDQALRAEPASDALSSPAYQMMKDYFSYPAEK